MSVYCLGTLNDVPDGCCIGTDAVGISGLPIAKRQPSFASSWRTNDEEWKEKAQAIVKKTQDRI